MNQLIQVTGLPRSGTAFIATLLNLNPDCLAFHELAATDLDWRKTIEESRKENLWTADVSTCGFFPKTIVNDSVKVFIDTPWKESRHRAQLAFRRPIEEGSFEAVHGLLKLWAEEFKPLTIESSKLWSVNSMRAIWEHCFGVEPTTFPEQKAKLMLEMNIQRHRPDVVFGKDCFAGRRGEFC